jgi:RNA polymerase sigma factor (sigma-70 family)
MRDSSSVAALVARARDGDKRAWDAIVERYAPLIWSICRRYRLDRADTDDVGQSVWLRLVDQLGQLREPEALPGWLATTTRRECGRLLTGSRRREALGFALDPADIPDGDLAAAEEEVLAAERHAALREAFAALPLRCQELLGLLITDPPVPYAEISAKLGIPVGSIGPSRARCLDRLRQHPAVAALISNEIPAGGGPHD